LQGITVMRSGTRSATNSVFDPAGLLIVPIRVRFLTPAEHWLELEAGVTPLFGRRSKEWNTDLVFGEPRSDSRQKASFVSCG
jgi:hypothetical protein